MAEALTIFLTIFSSIHVAYLFILLIRLRKSESLESQHSVSVIIAARNEEKNLPDLLEALDKQSHPNFEVIIANDRSTDHTEEILKEYNDRNWLRIITIEELPRDWNSKKHALYRAIEMARNDVLLFTDADCLPKSDQWIEKMTRPIDGQKQIVLGYSPYQSSSSILNKLIQFETLLTALQYLGLANIGFPYMAVGRNWAIRKELYPISFLKSISSLTGGDDDLIAQHICNSRNTCICFDLESQTSSKAEENLADLIRQKTRHLSVGQFYSKKSKTLVGIFTFTYGISWLLFLVLIISQQWSTALLIYGIRSLSFYIIFIRLGQKLDTKSTVWALPILDFCYPLWYAFLGIRSLAAKQIEWKPESSFLIKH